MLGMPKLTMPNKQRRAVLNHILCRSNHVITFLFLFASMLCALPVYACYSGLVIIPTADTIGKGQCGVELQMDVVMSTTKADTQLINTEFGIGDRMELGVDFDESEGAEATKMINAKLVLANIYSAKTSIAAGVCNLANEIKSNPFLVATKDCNEFRVHFGGIHIDGKQRWFAGVDHALNDRLIFMADYTNGLDNYSSLGFGYQISSSKSILAGVVFPNGSGDSLFTMHFVMNNPINSLIGVKK